MMKKNRSYSEATHLYGRISTASAILMFLMVPIAISVRYAAWPPFRDVLKGLLGVVPVFWTVGVIEVLTYAPMLGTGGTYLAFEPGTDEAEALSTIAVATSSLVTTLVIALGVFGIRFLQPVLENPVLKPAFDNIMPALMGSLALVYFSKNWKLSVAPLVFMIALFIAVPSLASSVGSLVPVAALVALLAGWILQKKGLIQ